MAYFECTNKKGLISICGIETQLYNGHPYNIYSLSISFIQTFYKYEKRNKKSMLPSTINDKYKKLSDLQ